MCSILKSCLVVLVITAFHCRWPWFFPRLVSREHAAAVEGFILALTPAKSLGDVPFTYVLTELDIHGNRFSAQVQARVTPWWISRLNTRGVNHTCYFHGLLIIRRLYQICLCKQRLSRLAEAVCNNSNIIYFNNICLMDLELHDRRRHCHARHVSQHSRLCYFVSWVIKKEAFGSVL